METKNKLLLIDGHSIINRAFYGVPPLTNSEGLHTNAIKGFLNIFFNAFSKHNPSHVIVAFDLKEKTFRHKMYEAYKGTRKGMPDELHEQVPVLQDVLKSMQILTATLPGFEADDILGTYATLAANDGFDVVILSGDRDLLQLASDKIMVSIPKTKSGGTEIENYFADDVLEKYGVTPLEFIQVKALQGDASDNIPGIPGIGEKTAVNIISKYKSLENAYNHADEITPNRAKTNLVDFIEQGRLSLELATIIKDAPVPFDFHEALIDESSFYNNDSFNIFKRLEFNSFLNRFETSAINKTDVTYEVKTCIDDFKDFVNDAINNNFALGVFFDESFSFLSISCKKGNYIFDFSNASLSELDVKNIIMDLFNSNLEIYVFGLKDMLHALDCLDFSSKNIFDLQIAAYLLNPNLPSFLFDNIANDYLGKTIPSKENLIGKSSIKDALTSNTENAYNLISLISSTAFECFKPLKEKLQDLNMYELFYEMEMPLLYSLYNMERVGIKVDKNVLDNFSLELGNMISSLESEIYEEAGEEFNINSPKQLGVILFEKLKLPHGKKTKTGYSTSADVLEKLAVDFPFVNKILKYRQVAKLKSTYADGLTAFISEDGRIHGTFNQTVTATGRISSQNPNLQNIPIRSELGQEIRKAFVADDGCILLDADYSQIELRLLAELSGDVNLIEAYKSDADIHKITASKVFNTPLDEVTKEQRRNAKAVNFGIVYGISSFGLSQDLSISRSEASEYINQYFETYPDVKVYLDNTVKRAKIDGFTTTLFNRIRPIPEILSSNFMQRSFGERAAMNAPIQGTAADIIKIAMINVEKALLKNNLKARIVLQVHDELLIEAPIDEADMVKEILYSEMSSAVNLKVPLEVEVNIGKDWFEAH